MPPLEFRCKSASLLGVAILAGIAAAGPLSAGTDPLAIAGTGTGPIPDATGACDTAGAPLVVSFDVSAVAGNVTTAAVSLTGTHTYVGDVQATLAAPGGIPSADLFGDTNSPGSPLAGDNSDIGGTYMFADVESGDWWAAAATAGNTDVIPAGGYRSTDSGSATQTSLGAAFAGLTPAEANGIWTLTVTDDCGADIGEITSAVLILDDDVIDTIFANGFDPEAP